MKPPTRWPPAGNGSAPVIWNVWARARVGAVTATSAVAARVIRATKRFTVDLPGEVPAEASVRRRSRRPSQIPCAAVKRISARTMIEGRAPVGEGCEPHPSIDGNRGRVEIVDEQTDVPAALEQPAAQFR